MSNTLVLRRKLNESLVFFVSDSNGNETQIKAKVTEIKGQVKFVLDVPDNVTVLRQELLHD